MLTRAVAAAASVLLFAGCGGSSETRDQASSRTSATEATTSSKPPSRPATTAAASADDSRSDCEHRKISGEIDLERAKVVGLSFGDSKAQVKAALGPPCEISGAGSVYNYGQTLLQFESGMLASYSEYVIPSVRFTGGPTLMSAGALPWILERADLTKSETGDGQSPGTTYRGTVCFGGRLSKVLVHSGDYLDLDKLVAQAREAQKREAGTYPATSTASDAEIADTVVRAPEDWITSFEIDAFSAPPC